MLHYEITGEGPPVVLLHEGIVDSRSWSEGRAARSRRTTPSSRTTSAGTGARRARTARTRSSRTSGRCSTPPASSAPRSSAPRAAAGSRSTSRSTHPERVTALVPVASAMSGHRIELDVPHPTSSAGWERGGGGGRPRGPRGLRPRGLGAARRRPRAPRDGGRERRVVERGRSRAPGRIRPPPAASARSACRRS